VRGYLWYQDGELLKASLLGAGTALGLAAAGWGWWRWRQARSRVYDPLQIKEKTSRIAFDISSSRPSCPRAPAPTGPVSCWGRWPPPTGTTTTPPGPGSR